MEINHSNWTLVTAYFNLTKCPDASEEIKNRNPNYYLSLSKSTLTLDKNLVIFCDQESYPKIKEIRPSSLDHKTKYYIMDFEDIPIVKNRDKIIQNRKNHPYYFDNRNTASYYLFCMSKYFMLKKVIDDNTFNSTHFCWINFCLEHTGKKNFEHLNECLSQNRDKFSTCYIDYVPHSLIKNTQEYFKWGRCSMASGFITGNKEYMYKVCNLIEDKFYYYLNLGYGHADEQLYSPVYFENTDLFEFYFGDYTETLTNYVYIYDRPTEPLRNFITNSYRCSDYKLCLQGCDFLYKSLKLGKCQLPDNLKLHFYEIMIDCLTKIN